MKLNKRTTNLLGAGVILILLVLAWLFVVSPSITKQQELNTALQTAKEQTEQYKGQIVTLQQVKADIGTYEQQDQDLSRKFPSSAEIELLLNDITNAGNKSQVGAITQVETGTPELVVPEGAAAPAAPAEGVEAPPAEGEAAPPAEGEEAPAVDGEVAAPETPSNDLAIMELTITAEGSQESLRNFASNLASMPRAFLINNTSITCEEKNTSSCDASIVGTTYLHRPAPSPDQAAEQATAGEAPAETTPGTEATAPAIPTN